MTKNRSVSQPMEPVGAKAEAVFPIAALIAVLFCAVSIAQFFFYATDTVGPDNDDAMRLVEVRDLLGGQGWFDMHQYRLGLDGGVLMHWSRLVDLPMVLLMRLFGPVLAPAAAETAAIFIWPLLLVLPLFHAVGIAGRNLATGLQSGEPRQARSGIVIAIGLAALMIFKIGRFDPGRIDHHNVQLVLMALMAAMLTDPQHRASRFFIAALAAALALAVGSETTPLVAVGAMAVALLWGLRGEAYRPAAAAFGLGLAGWVWGLFFLLVPQSDWSVVTCDNISLGFVGLAATGGVCLGLAALVAGNRGLPVRFGLLALTGVAVGLMALWLTPQCLQSPLANLDPLLVRLWLNNVVEVQSLPRMLALDPRSVGAFYAPGLLAIAICLYRIGKRDRLDAHLILFLLVTMAFAVTMVQARGSIFSNLFAAIICSAAIADLRQVASREPKNILANLGFIGVTLASVPVIWILIGNGIGSVFLTAPAIELAKPASLETACRSEKTMLALGALPAGTVAASSELGSTILRYTRHRVLSAPYHRNQGGMLAELKAGLAAPAAAETILRDAHVTLLAFCADDVGTQISASENPSGLNAVLSKGVVPAFLQPVDLGIESDLKVYRVAEPAAQ